MRIQHNIMAMNAYRNYTTNTSAVAKNLEKLSSGYRINRAGDDAAGLAISEKMRAQITGLSAAQKNVKDGISLVKTAEGATQEIHDMLNRMVYLAEQSANGTYQDEVDREAITNEFEQLKSEINRIADSSNFNGIKLLDGSLDAKAGADKVDIIGVNSVKSLGTKAVYSTEKALTDYGAGGTEGAEGDVLTFNVGFEDGTSTTVKLTMAKDANGDLKNLVSEDGKTVYATLATAGVVTGTEMADAVVKALNGTDLGKEFAISNNGDKIKMEALKEGTDGRVVRSFDLTVEDKNGVQKSYAADPADTDPDSITVLGVDRTAGTDEGREIKASDIIEYNGKNLDDALFTINGKKFVVLANEMNPSKNTGTTGTNLDYLRAATGLSDDVTILVGGIGGLMAGGATADPTQGMNKADADTLQTAVTTAQTDLDTKTAAYNTAKADYDANPTDTAKETAMNNAKTAMDTAQTALDAAKAAAADAPNANFEQNCKAIEEATGLKVTGSVDGDGNAIGLNAGIRLSKGAGNGKNGLTLQIGDTSESFNQLKVSIADMHTKALGIDGLSLGNQKGAQDAVAKIKDAINYVSDTRGTLGATQNRLEHTQNNLSVMKENIQDAESSIRDTDIAEEMMAYTKNNILVQSAQAMLAQANQLPQGVLQLLG